MVRFPTRGRDWRLLGRTLRLVLAIPRYALLALLAAVLALSLFVFAQNLELLEFAVTAPLDLEDRVTILLQQFPFVGTTFALETSAMLVLVALLTGADIALVGYHLLEHDLSARDSGGSVVGVGLGVLGAGCAACGSAVLAGVLSLVGVTGLLTALPLDGLEFSLLAAVVLVLSMYWLADGMRGGEIRGCPIDP